MVLLGNAVVLGLVQGVFEWLPVSSEGLVAAAYTLLYDAELDEAVGFALWLHLGTAPAALVALRREVVDLARGLLARPSTPSPALVFLAVATVVSAAVAFPLLLTLSELSSAIGGGAMLIVGAAMLVTGAAQLRRPAGGARTGDDARAIDSVLAGVAQGVAVIPGLSRSGLTVAVLLARRIEARQAMSLSFLMSVPASVGAALYVAVSSGVEIDAEAVLAAFVAFAAGLVTIRLLLGLAARINFAGFALAVGAVMAAGALWDMLR